MKGENEQKMNLRKKDATVRMLDKPGRIATTIRKSLIRFN
jgi:hypothetical protein